MKNTEKFTKRSGIFAGHSVLTFPQTIGHVPYNLEKLPEWQMGTIVCQFTNQWMPFLFMWDLSVEELPLWKSKTQNQERKEHQRVRENTFPLICSFVLIEKAKDRCVGGSTFIWSLRRYMTLYFVSYMHDRDGPVIFPGRQGKCACYLTGCMHKSTRWLVSWCMSTILSFIMSSPWSFTVLYCRCTANNF